MNHSILLALINIYIYLLTYETYVNPIKSVNPCAFSPKQTYNK